MAVTRSLSESIGQVSRWVIFCLTLDFIAVDGGYGKEPAFVRALDARGKRFVADVHKDQLIYVTAPQPAVPAKTGRGRRPSRASAAAPIRVDAWAAAQPQSAWQRRLAYVLSLSLRALASSAAFWVSRARTER
jgi:hypothetical protein